MKTLLQLSCLLLVLTGLLHAEVPRKPLPSKYRNLWQNSPFTTKPVTASGPVYNPLEDYVLLGVSPIDQGYRVTMLNRKRPNDGRLIVESKVENDGYKILDVMRSPGNPLKTTVKLSQAGKTGTIGFEDKFLKLKPPPANSRAQQPNNGVQPGTAKPNQPPGTRVPRRRIIPPTSGGGQQSKQPNTSGQGSRSAPVRSSRTR